MNIFHQWTSWQHQLKQASLYSRHTLTSSQCLFMKHRVLMNCQVRYAEKALLPSKINGMHASILSPVDQPIISFLHNAKASNTRAMTVSYDGSCVAGLREKIKSKHISTASNIASESQVLIFLSLSFVYFLSCSLCTTWTITVWPMQWIALDRV